MNYADAQTDTSKFYLLARGYTAYEDLNARIENVLKEIAEPSPNPDK